MLSQAGQQSTQPVDECAVCPNLILNTIVSHTEQKSTNPRIIVACGLPNQTQDMVSQTE